MYTLCMDFAKRFPNVEKTEYFSSADSIRIYGSAYIFDEDTSYITDIIPNTMFGRNSSNHWDCEDGWDRYESYSVILHHGSRCRTGEFSTGKELEDLIHELFDTDDPAGFFLSNSDIAEYHERADKFFSSLVHQLEAREILDIVNIDYLLKTVTVVFNNQKNMWRLSVETKKEIVPLPEGRYMFTPFIRAVERDNPAYVHYRDIYSVVTADNAEDFIDQILNPRNEEYMNINEIVDVISGV